MTEEPRAGAAVAGQSWSLEHPVFVVGAPRSGTTWVQRLLLSHPLACGGQESHFFLALGPALRQFDPLTRSPRLAGLANYWTQEAFQGEVRSLWFKTMAPFVPESNEPALLLVEKTPAHALFLREILGVLPGARIIHVIRDSRAVVASMLAAKEQLWGQKWGTHSARVAARAWVRHVSAARQVGQTLTPEVYTEVFYEDLFDRPVQEVQRLLAFGGLTLGPDEARDIVSRQDFHNQQTLGGTPFVRRGEMERYSGRLPEPPGFFHRGRPDSWKSQLKVWEKLVVSYITRQLLVECGYPRKMGAGGVTPAPQMLRRSETKPR